MEHLLGAAVLVLNLSRRLRELETFLVQDIVYFRLYDLLNHSLLHQRGQIRSSCDDFTIGIGTAKMARATPFTEKAPMQLWTEERDICTPYRSGTRSGVDR